MNDSHPIGLVGLGLVGQALGKRLLQAGFAVRGFDLRAEARDAFAARGGTACATVREVGAQCETVVLAVFETRDVQGIVADPGGLLAPGSAVQCLVDCSTGDPEQLVALASQLRERDIRFIEAPLSGASTQIEAGEATQLLGGAAIDIRERTALFDALSRRRIHVGPAGMAAKAKLATNLVLGLNRAVLAEGFAYAETLGISPAMFLELVLATPARSAAAEVKGPMMVSGDFAPQSRIRQHLKDVDLMLASARAAGQPLPLSETHASLMRRAVESGDGDLDNAAIVRQWRRERTPPN
ncbi:NAD(P)-dependent oxidoreductase [Ramlibacter albus]|uniref:NAD(P)-dependent oxidoreductase n=1 Tax=Ramlibacter albus TaxID=2079448 RepID=A0A923S358_9BURK|nr:NAD(P)-dependent oxidoreductase [Ramlibacter albus]MBC5766100.1 NAD(P)-dependent oxidoreductase [Ramlibacter albus]